MFNLYDKEYREHIVVFQTQNTWIMIWLMKFAGCQCLGRSGGVFLHDQLVFKDGSHQADLFFCAFLEDVV
jgi:hypothetical protein